MTQSHQHPAPEQAVQTQPETARTNTSPGNAHACAEAGLAPRILDIAADGTAEALRNMGPVGTIVMDALPLPQALEEARALMDLAWVRDWVFDLDPAAVTRAAPGLALQLVDAAWPVGVALGMDAALKVHGELAGLYGDSQAGGLTEVMRDGPNSTTARSSLEGALEYTADVTTNLEGVDVEALVGLHACVDWEAPLDCSVDELLRLVFLGATRQELPVLLSERVSAGLEAAEPRWAVRGTADMGASVDAYALADQLPGRLPNDTLALLFGKVNVGARVGQETRIEGDEDGMRAVFRLDRAVDAGTTGGWLTEAPVVAQAVEALQQLDGELALELAMDLESELPSFAWATVERDGDLLTFQSAEGLAAWLQSLVVGCGSATMAEALRTSGLSGLSRSVRRPLTWDSPLIPDGVAGGMTRLGDPELVLEARVDAERLATAFEQCPYPVDMGRLGLGPEDGLRAALDVVRGQRPPGWWTLTPGQLADCVELQQPRVQGQLRAETEARHTLTEKSDPGLGDYVKAGSKGIWNLLGTKLDSVTALEATGELGASARMDLPVEAPDADIWKEL